MITQDELKEIFDYRDGDLFWKISSAMRVKKGNKAGGTNGIKQPYKRVMIKNNRYLVHKLIYLWHHGRFPSIVDHIDGDISNNRIENLREATKSQNRLNSKMAIHNKSGSKNVHWFARRNKWAVNIQAEKKRMFLGYFDDFELAELVAFEARNKFHGNFANHF